MLQRLAPCGPERGARQQVHLLQLQRHATAGLPHELQGLNGCDTHAVSGCLQCKPAPVSLNAFYLNMAWPIWQCCCCDSVAFPLQWYQILRAICRSDERRQQTEMVVYEQECRHILCYEVLSQRLVICTSTAQPIQSNPGPRLAIVAGANAFASFVTGFLTLGLDASDRHVNLDRRLRKILQPDSDPGSIGVLFQMSCFLLGMNEHLLHDC